MGIDAISVVILLAVLFIGYDVYRVEQSIHSAMAELKEIKRELNPSTIGSIGYEMLKAVDRLDRAIMDSR